MTTDEYDALKARIDAAKRRIGDAAQEERERTAFDLLPEHVKGKLVTDYCVYLDVAQHIANGTWPYPEDVLAPGIILGMARDFFAGFNFMGGTYADAERGFAEMVFDHFRNQQHQHLPKGEPWSLPDGDHSYWRKLFRNKDRWHRIRTEAHRQLALEGIDEV